MKDREQILEEALDAVGDLRRSGLAISMGVGKTHIGLEHMRRQYTDIKKFLVVCPKTTIYDSWKNDAVKFGIEYLLDHITFTTYKSLTKHNYDYDYIYLDECHSLKHTHNKWLYGYLSQWNGKVLGLTGTYPVYKTTEKGKMCNFYCPKVYEYTPDEAIEDKILNDYQIYVHEINLNKKKTIPKNGVHGEFMSSEFNDYQYWTEALDRVTGAEEQRIAIQRMKVLQSFKTKELYGKLLLEAQTEKTIIFATDTKQADRICSDSVHSYNARSKENLEAFKKGTINKLSTVEQLSEGINIPNLKHGIILHSYGNNRKAAQKIGRLLRLNPDDKSTVHILCYVDSIDKSWVSAALKEFDQSKIEWIKPKFFEGLHY